jgi:uncharacterized protein YndB with AHSA1/START domain
MLEREVVLTRIFDAPRDLEFKLWVDPRHLAQWWGPHGFTNLVCRSASSSPLSPSMRRAIISSKG